MAFTTSLLLALSLSLTQVHASTPSSSTTFDYVIIGGGTSGLVLANRLSADPKVTVGVIEAGLPQRDNINVTSVKNFPLALGTNIDWNYVSSNQTNAAGQSLAYHAGKALGGTSTINGEQLELSSVATRKLWNRY